MATPTKVRAVANRSWRSGTRPGDGLSLPAPVYYAGSMARSAWRHPILSGAGAATLTGLVLTGSMLGALLGVSLYGAGLLDDRFQGVSGRRPTVIV
jgi:hypothetical protein